MEVPTATVVSVGPPAASLEGAKRAAELQALREEAAREQAAAAEALATRQREALREQAAAAECASAPT